MNEMPSPEKVGELHQEVIYALGLRMNPGQEILLGETNISHMQSRHPDDYACYGSYISDILAAPDYVGLNRRDNSIEYVKEFQEHGEYVKVAVRVSLGGSLFARSLYVLSRQKVMRFIRNGTLKKALTNPAE